MTTLQWCSTFVALGDALNNRSVTKSKNTTPWRDRGHFVHQLLPVMNPTHLRGRQFLRPHHSKEPVCTKCNMTGTGRLSLVLIVIIFLGPHWARLFFLSGSRENVSGCFHRDGAARKTNQTRQQKKLEIVFATSAQQWTTNLWTLHLLLFLRSQELRKIRTVVCENSAFSEMSERMVQAVTWTRPPPMKTLNSLTVSLCPFCTDCSWILSKPLDNLCTLPGKWRDLWYNSQILQSLWNCSMHCQNPHNIQGYARRKWLDSDTNK